VCCLSTLAVPGRTCYPGGMRIDVEQRVWAPGRRVLTAGLVLTITLAAFEALAVVTILPLIAEDLQGLRLYGWVTSAFFLGTLVGVVVAGQEADRRGPAPPFAAGLAVFAAGLALGGAAPTMGLLVAARALQGLGAGALTAVSYVAVRRAYPEAVRPRVFAIWSTAWVMPGLVGPAVSAEVAQRLGWRIVFLGLLVGVAVSALLTLPALRKLGRGTGAAARMATVRDALRVAAGTGLVLAGLLRPQPVVAAILLLAGGALGFGPLRRLLPAGTLRARGHVPAAIASRGLLTFVFFGADSYIPLTLTSVRGQSVRVAGLVLTASTLSWTAGAWVQERLAARWSPRHAITLGMCLLSASIVVVASGLLATTPLAVPIAGWTTAAFGIGLAYAPTSLVVLARAPDGQEGSLSAALQLSDNLGVAIGAGLGGAAVAYGEAAAWPASTGLAIAFGSCLLGGALGIAVTARLP